MAQRFRTFIALATLLAATPAFAVHVQEVRITGIADAEQLHNAMLSVSLLRDAVSKTNEIGDERLSFMLRKAPEEIRTALEPYGYYDTKVEPTIARNGDNVNVTFAVTLGEPVHVTTSSVAMNGAAHDDKVVMRQVETFRPRIGAVLDHRVYEASKLDVSRNLNDRGYFDANLGKRRVEVTRATHSADIDVAWDSGVRYAFGATTFAPNQLRPGLLDPLLRWTPGEPYDQSKLLAMQQALIDLDYFAVVNVEPDLAHKSDGKVPIKIDTTPAKRNVYSAGLSYGTDSGAGVQLGFDRRWINRRGHKFTAQLDYAQKLKVASAQYRIPAFRWLDGWYAMSTSVRDEETDAGHTQLAELVGSRTGIWRDWTLTAAMHAQRERYQDALYPDFNRYATLVFPALTAQYTHTDNKLYPTRGWGLTTDLRGGSTAIGSDVSFVQARLKATFVHSFGWRNRLLLRGEIGRTFTGDFNDLPPSLRFYAGGDNSVRGYGYQEIGPRVNDRNLGGRNLAVFSVEAERRFTQTWGMAAFVDGGDAFDTSSQLHLGVGVGLRWRSPVGPVRIDIAHGLDHPASPVRLHLNIGTDL